MSRVRDRWQEARAGVIEEATWLEVPGLGETEGKWEKKPTSGDWMAWGVSGLAAGGWGWGGGQGEGAPCLPPTPCVP